MFGSKRNTEKAQSSLGYLKKCELPFLGNFNDFLCTKKVHVNISPTLWGGASGEREKAWGIGHVCMSHVRVLLPFQTY